MAREFLEDDPSTKEDTRKDSSEAGDNRGHRWKGP